MEQFFKFLAVHLKASGSLVNADLKDVFDLFVREIGGLDQKVGQRRVPGDDSGSDCLASGRWQGAGELRGRRGIAADQHHSGGLRAFAQDINQPIEEIPPERDQFGIRVVELGVALKGEEELLLIGKDALGIRGERGLINLAGDLLWRRANGA